MTDARLPNLLGAAAVGLRDLLDRLAVEVTGLQGEGAAALVTVGSRPGRPVEHLRRSVGLSHSGGVRLVDRLEERGWIERVAPNGGREVHLFLTPTGEGIFRRLLDARRTALERVLTPLPDEDRAALERGLESLLAALPSGRTEAWRICRLCDHGVCRGPVCPVGSSVDAREPGS